jgi:hypothetical protein
MNDALDPQAAANLAAYRHRKAMAEADRIDTRFYNRNPGRVFHLRKSLPFEGSDWDAGNHLVRNSALVMLSGKTAHRRFIGLHDERHFIADERYLAAMWARVAIGEDIYPWEVHKMLVDTGNWQEST